MGSTKTIKYVLDDAQIVDSLDGIPQERVVTVKIIEYMKLSDLKKKFPGLLESDDE